MTDSREPALHPIFLKLQRRRVLVVGAGAVAERKIAALLEAEADVIVVAPKATEAVQAWAAQGALRWHARGFAEPDAEGAWIVVAATSDPEVQRRAARAAEERRIFVLAVDDIANATAYSGAIVRRAPFTIAISSSGEAPALTRLIRELIEQVLPGPDWVERAKELRAEWIEAKTPATDRFGALVRDFAARRNRA
jgi:uroporphyrin-III C-methyltransferase/precorrin-2 dehydrogenase/sirohydrochlorin ferrochelatase